MKRFALPTLQLFGAAAIFCLGVMIAAQSRRDFTLVIGLMGVGLIGLVAPRFASPAPTAAGAAREAEKEAARHAQDHSGHAALQQFIRSIKGYGIINSSYGEDLSGLSGKLLQLPARNDARDIIVELISTNLATQLKVLSMAKELEASRLQIVSLRNNILEVGKIALIDALTGLGNRRFFDQTLQKEIERARKTGAGLCLALADLDRFKAVNDRFGHIVGDHLLKLFSGVLVVNLRAVDVPARYGGEEFALLFPGASLDEASRIVEETRRDLESKRWVVGPKEERLGPVTASFGIARLALDEAAESFIQRADAKLFEAKAAGRNRVAVDRADQNPSRPAVSAG